MNAGTVLLVDDDVKLLKLLRTYFEKDSFSVLTATNGIAALRLISEHAPDAVVLDLMLPEMDGWAVCRQLREDNEIPILMLTARDAESDRLEGLEIGADDYVVKPFSPREVVARVKAILRRSRGQTMRTAPLFFDGLVVDTARHTVKLNGEPLELTPVEFKLLTIFMLNPGKVFTRLQLVEQIQGYNFDGLERTIDVHIKNLRRKIEADSKNPGYIVTVYGVGYKLETENRELAAT